MFLNDTHNKILKLKTSYYINNNLKYSTNQCNDINILIKLSILEALIYGKCKIMQRTGLT